MQLAPLLLLLLPGHHQELSVADLLWWNPPLAWFNRRLWSRVSGKALVVMDQVLEQVVTK